MCVSLVHLLCVYGLLVLFAVQEQYAFFTSNHHSLSKQGKKRFRDILCLAFSCYSFTVLMLFCV